MIYEYMEENSMNNFGCVVICDNMPQLFIVSNDEILEGIPLDEEDCLYSNLNEDDMVIVAVKVLDGETTVDALDITDDNVFEMEYVMNPLYVHSLQTDGLVFDDIIDMELFEMVVFDILEKYIQDKY